MGGIVSEIDRSVLINGDALEKKAREMSQWIDKEYRGKNLVMVPVLLGAIPTTAALMKYVTLPDVEMDAIRVKSYDGKQSTKDPKIVADLVTNIKGRHVLLIEDIVDTRHTIKFLMETLLLREPASLKTLAMLNKSARQETDADVHQIGFEIPDVWVEGFGLDTDGLNRMGGDVTYRNPTEK